jgi:hypothetical protein
MLVEEFVTPPNLSNIDEEAEKEYVDKNFQNLYLRNGMAKSDNQGYMKPTLSRLSSIEKRMSEVLDRKKSLSR